MGMERRLDTGQVSTPDWWFGAWGGSDEMGRKIKLVCRRGVGERSWESESKVESCGNEGRK